MVIAHSWVQASLTVRLFLTASTSSTKEYQMFTVNLISVALRLNKPPLLVLTLPTCERLNPLSNFLLLE